MAQITRAIIVQMAGELGLTPVGISGVDPLAAEIPRLERWQESCSAGMSWMRDKAEARCSPLKLMPEARSIVSAGAPLCRLPLPERPSGWGRVARFAWGRDYHVEVRARLAALVSSVERALGRRVKSRLLCDSAVLLERGVASRAGLGFIGRNTLLIAPPYGSRLVLGEVIWDVEIGFEDAPVCAGCRDCRACRQACPTGALTDDFVLDAARCRAYLSIEKRGVLSFTERDWLGEWIFGCDVCQESCPFNSPAAAPPGRGVGWSLPEKGAGGLLSLGALLAVRSDGEFRSMFQGTPLLRPGREGLLRNAAVAAGNTGAAELAPLLAESAARDPSAIVRRHALWALYKLAKECRIPADAARRELERARSADDQAAAEEAARLRELI